MGSDSQENENNIKEKETELKKDEEESKKGLPKVKAKTKIFRRKDSKSFDKESIVSGQSKESKKKTKKSGSIWSCCVCSSDQMGRYQSITSLDKLPHSAGMSDTSSVGRFDGTDKTSTITISSRDQIPPSFITQVPLSAKVVEEESLNSSNGSVKREESLKIVTNFYPSLRPKALTTTPISTPRNKYQEVPSSEPDLNKQPKRSAMKGAKERERQRELLEGTEEKLNGVVEKLKLGKKGDSDDDDEEEEEDEDEDDDVAPNNFLNLKSNIDGPMLRRKKRDDGDGCDGDGGDDDHRNKQKFKVRRRLSKRRRTIGVHLNSKLSQRPSFYELEEKNILMKSSAEERKKNKEDIKRTLMRKLTFRPTVSELRDRQILKFNDYVEVAHTDDVDRKAERPWTKLTSNDKAYIRKELNLYKSTEMIVHQESKHNTRFHEP